MNYLQRAAKFKALHYRPGIFVVPNPWDSGSAIFLEHLGFEALATTSAGLAYTLGKADGMTQVSREETLKNASAILEATQLPVSADLENCFGDDPEQCALTIRLAAQIGLSGGSIEDASGHSDAPIYPFELAVNRVRAAVRAVRSLSHPFILTARAENYLHGQTDLADTIRRLTAYAKEGADVLYAPGVKSLTEIKEIVRAVHPKPVNVLMGFPDVDYQLSDLEAIGVKRVSVGSSLARAAYGGFSSAAEEILRHGKFSYAKRTTSYADLNQLFNAQADKERSSK
jgi:2-methylisocitrate lyase-like PEP mutase family enzyme